MADRGSTDGAKPFAGKSNKCLYNEDCKTCYSALDYQ